jgi:hypothetical protein
MLGHGQRIPAWLRQAIAMPRVCVIFQHHSEAAVRHGHTELCELLEKKK